MISPKKYLLSSLAALSLLGMPLSSTAQTGSATEAKVQPKIEPQAIAILRAMGERLAATRSLKFTAVTTYESPSRIGPPLLYTTTSEVTLQRPIDAPPINREIPTSRPLI